MEYVQERVATLHDFGHAAPDAPIGETTVVVPMMQRDYASLAAERVLATLSQLSPAGVVIPLRADADTVGDVLDWVEGFALDAEVLWCSAPAVSDVMADAGLDGPGGKGRDVWLGIGQALTAEYVVVHDVDARTFDAGLVRRLAFPLGRGRRFVKGYYARIENQRLYGRLFRLFVVPLLRALDSLHDHPVLDYLRSFRYALAGEFAMTTALARQVRAQPGWGLEVGTLGEAYRLAGFGDSAQVDLGVHEHDHRAVGGPDGLGEMAGAVGDAVVRTLVDAGVEPAIQAVRSAYREAGRELVEQYAADAAFNGIVYDAAAERDQVETYAEAIDTLGPDRRLPAWADAPVAPAAVRTAAEAALATER